MNALVAADLLRAVAESDNTGYQPATPPDATTLGEVIDALRRHGERDGPRPDRFQPPPGVRVVASEMEQAVDSTVRRQTVRDLVTGHPGESAVPAALEDSVRRVHGGS